jgi:hypothetical protein
MMSTQTLLMRRTVLQTAAAATTLAAPFVRGAHAAEKLSVFKKDLTGLLVVDPYNDFISEGGILCGRRAKNPHIGLVYCHGRCCHRPRCPR